MLFLVCFYKNATVVICYLCNFSFLPQLHAGDGLFVDIAKIKNCESTFNFNRRVQNLLMAFYPEDFGKRTLAPERIKGQDSEEPNQDFIISENHVVVLAS